MDWPLEPGEYVIVDPKKRVAVVTLDDEVDLPLECVALYGKSRTENLGVERVVLNVISNPNIRFLVVCGSEIHGHLAGQAIVALHENGIDDRKKIVGAKGAIPYIQNLPEHFIERFRCQVMEVADLIDVVDEERIGGVVRELAARKTGPFEGEVIDFDKYLIKAESALAESLDFKENEVYVSPEYGITLDTVSGRIMKTC